MSIFNLYTDSVSLGMSEFGVKNINITGNENILDSSNESVLPTIKNVWGQPKLPDLLDESCSIIQNSDDSLRIAMKLSRFMEMDKYLSDELLLSVLDEIMQNNISVAEILQSYRLKDKDAVGFLDALQTKKQIKPATVEKFKKYFNSALELEYDFQRKLERKGISSEFRSGSYEYQSDKYDVVQKNENILEIKNLSTNQTKVINFSNLAPEGLNGLNDIVALKSSIQKLPPEILFRIPDEVSVIKNIDVEVIQGGAINPESGEMDFDGGVGFYETGEEIVLSSDSPETLVHEIAHTVFMDKDGNDTLYNKSKIVEYFEKAVKSFEQDGNKRFDEKKKGEDTSHYWTSNLSEFGAEVVTAVFMHNYDALDSLQRYAPDAFALVMEHFENRENAQDKHKKYLYE